MKPAPRTHTITTYILSLTTMIHFLSLPIIPPYQHPQPNILTIFFRFSDINIRSLNSDKNFFGHVLLSQQNREDDGLQHFLQAFTALLLDTAHTISVIDITQTTLATGCWIHCAVSECLLFLCTYLFKLIERGCVISKYLKSNLG